MSLDVQRIETGERLVENEQTRPMDDRDHELDHLPHALRECLHLAQTMLCQAHPGEKFEAAGFRLGAGQAFEAAQVADGIHHPGLGGQSRLFGQVSHFLQYRQLGCRAEHGYRAAIGTKESQSHADGGGLAGAVGAEETEDLPGTDGEGNVVNHRSASERLGDTVYLKCVFRMRVHTAHSLPIKKNGADCFDHLIRSMEVANREGYIYSDLLEGARRACGPLLVRHEERELELIAALEAALVPRGLPSIPGFELAVSFCSAATAATVGGDFYDVQELPSGDVLLLVGDYVGSGLQAAGMAARLRQAGSGLAHTHGDPGALLLEANRLALKILPPGRFPTLLACRIARDGRMSAASAGHPSPLWLSPGGAVEEIWLPRNPPLGVEDRGRYEGKASCVPQTHRSFSIPMG